MGLEAVIPVDFILEILEDRIKYSAPSRLIRSKLPIQYGLVILMYFSQKLFSPGMNEFDGLPNTININNRER